MNKTGLVLKTEKNIVMLVTNTGEFVNVMASSNLPKIGETYTGTLKKEKSYIKQIIAAAALFMIFISGGSAYAYYTPVATVEVSINPSIELKINRFDRIVKCSPTNGDGKTLLKKLQLKNRNIDQALTLVVAQAKKDNFINDDYISQGKTVLVKISAKDKDKTIKLDKLEEYSEKNKINTNINDNGKENIKEFNKEDKAIENNKKLENNKKNETNKEIDPEKKIESDKEIKIEKKIETDKEIKIDNKKGKVNSTEGGSIPNNSNTNNSSKDKLETRVKEKDITKDPLSKIKEDKKDKIDREEESELIKSKKNP